MRGYLVGPSIVGTSPTWGPSHFGGSPRIYAGEERFSAPKELRD